MSRARWTPRWLLAHAVVLALSVACVMLGLWQLRRLDERRAYNALVASRTRAAPAPLESVRSDYRRVVAEGTYDADREVLLRGRALNGRPGHHLLTPLRTDAGEAVVVDRGWIPLTADPARTRPPGGRVRITGILLPPERRGRFGPSDPPDGTLRAVARADIPRVARQLPYPVRQQYILLASQAPQQSSLPTPAPLPRPDEGRHLAYAVQWFLFVPVGLAVYAAVVRKALMDARPTSGQRPHGFNGGPQIPFRAPR